MNLAVPKYDVMEEIGVGGFGIVFRAIHKITSANVAIKIDKTNSATGNLIHESKIMIHLLNIRGACKFLGFGNAEYENMTVKYIAMQLSFPILFGFQDSRWKYVLEELCFILQNIHEKHVIHNDIKRSNVMFATPLYMNRPLPNIILIDFGLSRFIEPEDSDEGFPPFKTQFLKSKAGMLLNEMNNWCNIAKDCGMLDSTLEISVDKIVSKIPDYKAFAQMLEYK